MLNFKGVLFRELTYPTLGKGYVSYWEHGNHCGVTVSRVNRTLSHDHFLFLYLEGLLYVP